MPIFNTPWGQLNYGVNTPLPWGHVAPMPAPVKPPVMKPQVPVGQMNPAQITQARLGNFQQFGSFQPPKGARDALGNAIQAVPSNRMLGGRK